MIYRDGVDVMMSNLALFNVGGQRVGVQVIPPGRAAGNCPDRTPQQASVLPQRSATDFTPNQPANVSKMVRLIRLSEIM